MSQFESAFEEKFYNERVEKLAQIRALGVKAGLTEAEAIYPNTFRFTTDVPSIRLQFDAVSAEQLEADKPQVAIAGRLVAIRLQGKAGFATLQQGGQRLQIYVRKDDVGEDAFDLYRLLDLGDHIGVTGHLMRTRTGELTVKVHSADAKPPITFLAKAMLPLPDKYSGLGDIELRYRRRYLDLFTDTGDFAEPTSEPAANPTAEPPATGGEGGFSPLSPAIGSGALAPEGTTAEPTPAPTGGEWGFSPLSPAIGNGALAPEAATAAPTPAPTGGEGDFSPLSPAIGNGALAPEAATAAPTPAPTGGEGGFSPLSPAIGSGALAPEGTTAAPTQTRLPAREVFLKRAAILRSIRNFFDTRGYLEVETPMLHTVAGGAAARPFNTHHNALDIPLSLRIAPELYLKRLVVGGFDRVYEINRNFRNEGVSTQHNPEFTMLEFYQAYANYHDLMDLTQELITSVAKEVNGSTLTTYNGVEIDLSKWTKLSMREAIIKFWPPAYGSVPSDAAFTDRQIFGQLILSAIQAASQIADHGWVVITGDPPISGSFVISGNKIQYLTPQKKAEILRSRALKDIHDAHLDQQPLGKSISDLFEVLAEPHLIQPTIIYDFPLAVSPLSKVKPDEPDWVERFEFYIGGFEVGNAFSELNDPADQLARFEAQVADKDPESMAAVDEDYVRALGYGLPPTAGEGIGIDRLTMLLTGSRSIRDVILFPLMRPKAVAPDETTT